MDVHAGRRRSRRHVAAGIQQRVQLEHPSESVDVGGQLERLLDALGGDTGDADELLGADRVASSVSSSARARTAMRERQVQQMHLQHTSSAMRTSAECEKAVKSTSDSSGPE